MIHVPHAASWGEQITLPSPGCDFLSRGFGTLSQPGSSVLCRESDPLEESWFGPPLPSSLPPPTLRSFLRSFSLPGWKKATLSFYCRRQRSARRRRRRRSRSAAAAAHQTKSAVVMLLILLCLVTRHSDGDGRCRSLRRRREGGGRAAVRARESRGAAALPGRRAGRAKWPNRSGNTCFGRFNTLLHRSCAPPKDDGRNQETLFMTAPVDGTHRPSR